MRVSLLIALLTPLATVAGCAPEGLVGSLQSPAPAASPSVIAAGGDGTCVRTTKGEARCWGSNENGGLGIGESDPPASADPLMPVNLDGVVGLYGGELARCAVRINGELACWGRVGIANAVGTRFIDERLVVLNPFAYVGAVGEITSVAVGRFFLCSLGSAGEVRCFGKNDKGQLGLGDTADQINPTTVKGLDGPATSLATSMGGAFTCATTKSGSVYCWGDAPAGIAGDDPLVVVAPTAIGGLPEPAVQVAVGGAHACARLESGRVACWGAGNDGQLGDGAAAARPSPVFANVTDAVAISAGRAHTCAVRSEGSVFCWGAAALGAGPGGDTKLPTIIVESAFKTRAVSSGLGHSCAWGEGGRVVCWGDDSLSQLGPKQATF